MRRKKKGPSTFQVVRESSIFNDIPSIVKKQVKKNNSIIYGAQSINKQVGLFGRPTNDWDIFSKDSSGSAKQLRKTLNKRSNSRTYYNIPSAFHSGTHKVYHVGKDRRRGTKDDLGIADFSNMKRGLKVRVIDGIRYTKLSESVKDKKSSLSDEEFHFRHDKDRKDLDRINSYKYLNSLGRKK